MQHGLIGIDGGGSHTEAALCTTDGKLINKVIGGPASALGTLFDQSIENIKQLIDNLFTGLHKKYVIDCLCAGISGCGVESDRTRFAQMIRTLYPDISQIYVDSDILNFMYAVGEKDNVVIAICGTGSIAVGISGNQRIRVDGHGYLLGDDAGGYSIGRSVLHAILRREDGRGPDTLLADLFHKKVNKTAVESISVISNGGKMTIASFAPLAFIAASQGDAVANEILSEAAVNMAEMIRVAAESLANCSVTVVIGGSLWLASDSFILHRVQKLLDNKYRWLIPSLPVVYGAVVHAAELRGLEHFSVIES